MVNLANGIAKPSILLFLMSSSNSRLDILMFKDFGKEKQNLFEEYGVAH